ncbi:carbonic anhydrase [Anaerospora sp.]|uniref:carbonic anhydrase n=1 Tax=Anaerospora sp. TaxID=1960278 RepID=UPI002899F327|nr:carbonic anhydrase [Anaerospora sp.]
MHAYQALNELIRGNRRYVTERYAYGDTGAVRRQELTRGHFPFAAIMSCSDSRVPPEIIFDQGLGDIFVVRTAGQVVDSIALGSLEYAVKYLGVRLVVVLGHQDCGAVEAAIAGYPQPGQIQAVVDAIQPAVRAAKRQCGNLLTNSLVNNVYLGIDRLTSSQLLQQKLATGELQIIGAMYCMKSGRVFFL